ncbi:hypothetical protein [Hyphococcus sp.]|uniref:hypothetical protein n=1 Tax=Hyphococcus sp. TaxID=2038636 RepID=UPI002085C839|nr:MAG: hypothetical protein DHS20C04_23050 [Marinicaulis sp.]
MLGFGERSSLVRAIEKAVIDPSEANIALRKLKEFSQKKGFTSAFVAYLDALRKMEGGRPVCSYVMFKALSVEGIKAIQNVNLKQRTDEEALEDTFKVIHEILKINNLFLVIDFSSFEHLVRWQLFEKVPDGMTREETVTLESNLLSCD